MKILKPLALFGLLSMAISAQAANENNKYDFYFLIDGLSSKSTQSNTTMGITSLACNAQNYYAIANGQLWSMGSNTGMLARNYSDQDLNVFKNTHVNVDKIEAGYAFVAALDGNDLYYIRATYIDKDSTETHPNNPLLRKASIHPTSIAVGNGFIYAIVDGTVWSIGDNSKGQLGIGVDGGYYNTWQNTGLQADVVSSGESSLHGYAIKNGIVYSVGNNADGQLAIGNFDNKNTWQNTGTSGVTDIDAGEGFGYMLKDGIVWSVGANYNGQLGLGNRTNQVNWRNTFKEADAISAGFRNGYFLKDGLLYSAGGNNYGEIARPITSGSQQNYLYPTTFHANKIEGCRQAAIATKDDEIWGVGYRFDSYYDEGLGTDASGFVLKSTNE